MGEDLMLERLPPGKELPAEGALLKETLVREYRRKSKLSVFILLLLLFTLGLAVVVFCGFGVIAISPSEIARIIIGKATRNPCLLKGIDEVCVTVIYDIRLPRILTSAIVGAGLATSGAVLQALLLNPLADPYTLGVSTGAAFGASVAIYLGLTTRVFMGGAFTIPAFAFVGALFALLSVYLMARTKGSVSTINLVLSGVIISSILSAGISFLKNMAGENVGSIVFWLMGSFASRSWLHVMMSFPLVLAGILISFHYAGDLNVMSLGSGTAARLGIEEERVRVVLLVSSSLVTAACVSVSGIIGFVGLIIPHLVRLLIGPDNRALIPVSALSGSILLLSADTVARSLSTEVPVGVLTTLFGGPFFCYIFKTRANRYVM